MVLSKGFLLLRKYILTIPRFDLFLQGALLIVIFLESYVYLLIRRNAGTGLLSSITEDWVRIGVGGAEFLLGALVAWYGRGTRHFTLAAWLGATAVSGLLVLAFPYPVSRLPSVELCEGGSVLDYTDRKIEPIDHYLEVRTTFLVLTAVLCALTKISVWAHGVTYLDDHEPESGTYFYGILISIRLSVGLSSRNWLRNASTGDDWWQAHVSLSMLTLMFAILFTLFPYKMEGYKDFDEVEYNCVLAPIGRMLRNKALMLQVFALILLNTALFGYVNFDNASIEGKFYVETIRPDLRTRRTVNDIFRSLVIIFFVSIFRMRFSGRRSDGVKAGTAARVGGVVCVLVAAFFAVLAGLQCDTGTVVGLGGGYEQPSCSLDCGCKSETYGFSPVCLLNTSTTYFSPCHAGCRKYEDLNGFLLYSDCACAPGRAVRGACALPSCWLIYNIYLVFFTLVLATSAASFLMQGMAVLRAVPRRDKPIAIGVSFALVGLFSHSVGHLLYMGIGYLNCGYQEGSSCLLQDFTVWSLGASSAVLTLMSGAVSLLASRASRTSK